MKKYRKRAVTLQNKTFKIYYCFRTFPGPKRNFVPKGIQIGFEMADKKVYTQTHTKTFSYLYK